MLGEILDDLLISARDGPLHHRRPPLPRAPPCSRPFPSSLDPRIVEALARRAGSSSSTRTRPAPVELVAKGEHVVVVTPTASGKTLCYNLPVAAGAGASSREARALYLFPTKALAQDQLAELEELAKRCPTMRMFTYDGDTPQDARRAVRARANLVLTNPDMLHSGILPHHTKWVDAVPEPPLRRHRRAARLPRRVRHATWPTCCGGSSASARHYGVDARSSSWPRRRSPTRASWPAAHRRAGGGGHRERRARPARRRSCSTTRRSSIPSSASARRTSARRPSSRRRFLRARDRRRSSSPRAGCRPRCC